MTSLFPAPLPATTLEEILADLRRFEPFRLRPEISLTPLTGNPRRRDHLARRAFTVSHAGKIVCHLTIGPDLHELWKRAEAFHRACPQIASRLLFYEKGSHHEYLAREFIDGKTVEDLVLAGNLTAENACLKGAQIQEALAATAEPSTVVAAKAEAVHVFDQLSALPFLTALDQALFHETLAPIVFAGIETAQPWTRWTNGDFTPHNLIIDSTGSARLIDYEFAARTHFFAEDSWRWQNFSALPGKLEMPTTELMKPNGIPPWLEIFFWTKQLVLSHTTIIPEIACADSKHAIRKIIQLAGNAGVPLTSGLFLQALKSDSELQTQVGHLKTETHQLSDKIARMHASRSWRYTAPLRAIRRWLDR